MIGKDKRFGLIQTLRVTDIITYKKYKQKKKNINIGTDRFDITGNEVLKFKNNKGPYLRFCYNKPNAQKNCLNAISQLQTAFIITGYSICTLILFKF